MGNTASSQGAAGRKGNRHSAHGGSAAAASLANYQGQAQIYRAKREEQLKAKQLQLQQQQAALASAEQEEERYQQQRQEQQRQQQQRQRSGSSKHPPQFRTDSVSSDSTALDSKLASPQDSPSRRTFPSQEQVARRRKSIELPDLAPKLAFSSATQTAGSSAATPVSDSGGPLASSITPSRIKAQGMKDLRDFKLKLPEGIGKRGRGAGDDGSAGGSSAPLPTSGIEAMRLDAGEDVLGEGPAGFAAGDRTHHGMVPSAPRCSGAPATAAIEVSMDVEGTSVATPSAIAPDTDAIPLLLPTFPMAATPSVLIPLQQPIETVVPPLPPTITKPFPPPLPVESVPTSGSATAVSRVAAATEAVRQAPALDLGAGPDGVPTLITWKEPAHEVYVTGTFSRWKQQIKLRKNPEAATEETYFSALISLPPGPHRLKFIVDKKWKTSKYLPTATDAAGNLINYVQVNPGDQPFRGLGPRGIWSGYTYGSWQLGQINNSAVLDPHDAEWHENDEDWSNGIPQALMDYEDVYDNEHAPPPKGDDIPRPGEKGFWTEPPNLPAQLKEGILNMGSKGLESATDDNSLLPKPDHSVLNHLAASPIRNGMLSVAVTTRFRRKYLTTIYFKPVETSQP